MIGTTAGVSRHHPAYILPVKKTVVLYGIVCGLLVTLLSLVQYRFLVIEHSVEIYGAIVALLFATLGIWLGNRINRRKPEVVLVPVRRIEPFVPSPESLTRLGITPRELEILQAIASGLSTREIAEKLFVSENTVKTHSSRPFEKLSARRRTQAVQLAQTAGILP